MHTGGSKSFIKHAIEIEEDPERDAPQGTHATRVEVFLKTHTRKNKKPINDKAKEKMDEMKAKINEAIEEGLSVFSDGPDDIFAKVMGPDKKGQRRGFGRATFPAESSNLTSNKDNVEVNNLKRKLVDVDEELHSTKEQYFDLENKYSDLQNKYSDLQNTTKALQASQKTTVEELAEMRGYMRLMFPDKFSLPPTQEPRSSSSSPSSATHSNH